MSKWINIELESEDAENELLSFLKEYSKIDFFDVKALDRLKHSVESLDRLKHSIDLLLKAIDSIEKALPIDDDVQENLKGFSTIRQGTATNPYNQKESNFYNVPDSTASNLIMETLGAGADIADLPARKQQINHSTTYEVLKDGNKRLVSVKSRKAEVTVELADIDKITGSNKPAKKLFVLSLIKANEQAIHNGQLTKDYITFPLQELVNIGFYNTPQSARNGFKSGADILTSLKIKGKLQKSKKNGSEVDTLEVLFTGARIEKGQCFIFFNPRISWGVLTQYFTILPKYYFRLPNRASDLLYYIFYLARQNTRKIEQEGYFTIGFRAIQHRLQLPNEKGSLNPQRDIKEAIEAAIEQLEDEHSKTFDNVEFSLLPIYDDYAPITEFLDSGYLKITLSGEFAKTFIAISKDTEKQIKEAHKKQVRIQEKAIIKKLEKSEAYGAGN